MEYLCNRMVSDDHSYVPNKDWRLGALSEVYLIQNDSVTETRVSTSDMTSGMTRKSVMQERHVRHPFGGVTAIG